MILSRKANWAAIQEAKAKAKGKTQTEAHSQAWYDSIKDQLPADIPPPPIGGDDNPCNYSCQRK